LSNRAIAAAALAVMALVGSAITAQRGQAGGPGVIGYAVGNQNIQSSPGVYAQTTNEYATSWTWSQQSASYDYYWYLFHSNGVLEASGHKATGGGGSWSGAGNIYYFKEYNNEASGSGHINVLSVDYCC
jgi:hypothetical protein